MRKVKWLPCLYAIIGMATVCMASVKEDRQKEENPAIVKLDYTVTDEDGVEIQGLTIDLASYVYFASVSFNAWTPEPVTSNLIITVEAQLQFNNGELDRKMELIIPLPAGSNMVDKTFDYNGGMYNNIHLYKATVSSVEDAKYRYSVAFSN